MIETNPAQFVEKPMPVSSRDRVLNDAELVGVWKAAGQMAAPSATACAC